MNPLRLAFAVLRADSRSRVSAVFVAIGVAFGVALVLWLAAAPDALQARADRESWRSSSGAVNQNDPNAAVVIAQTTDVISGKLVERFDVAGLKPGVALPPGIPLLPGPDEVLVSPAMAKLPATAMDHFPGKMVGTLGEQALKYPEELVVVVGHQPGAIYGFFHPDLLGPIGAEPREGVLYLLTRLGLVVLAVPCLVLVASAARLTAARRERRLAALRLAGATPQQVIAVTAAEIAVAAVVGSVLGVIASFPLRHLTARIPWDGGTWMPDDFTANPAVLVAVAVLAPVAVVAAAVLGLRRVVSQPLGAAQQQRRPGPSPLRLALIAGAGAVFAMGVGAAKGGDEGKTTVLLGVGAVAVALVLAGPLVTAMVGRVFTNRWRKPATLLAGRRLRDDPKAAFRAAAGVVLAVFTASLALTLFPSLEDRIPYSDGTWRDDVLVAPSAGGDAQLARLHRELEARGLRAPVVPFVEGWARLTDQPDSRSEEIVIARCEDAAQVLAVLPAGDCRSTPMIYAPAYSGERLKGGGTILPQVRGDVRVKPIAMPANLPVSAYQMTTGRSIVVVDPALLPALDVEPTSVGVVANPDNREAVHTAMLRTLPGVLVLSNQKTNLRATTLDEDLWRATVIGLAIATVIGGVSAAVAAAGSVVDRRRTFGALVAAGTPVRVLARALRSEVVLPVLVAAFGASVAGLLVGAGLVTLAKGGHLALTPWLALPPLLGVGVALIAAAACGPVLRKVTALSYAQE